MNRRFFLLATLALSVLSHAERVRGTLVDARGKPIAAAVLRSAAFRGRGADYGSAVLLATTDSAGRFLIPNALAAPTADAPIPLMARLSGGRLVRVALFEQDGRAVVSGPPTRLRVRVVDDAGRPIAGATVEVEGVRREDYSHRWIDFQAAWDVPKGELQRVTDARGYVAFNELPDRSFAFFCVRCDGWLTSWRSVFLPAPGLEAEVVTPLEKGAVLTGRVVAEGKGLPGVRVVAQTELHRTSLYEIYTVLATTDAQGAYRIRDAHAGSVALKLELGKRAESWVPKEYEDVRVAAGARIDGLDFNLDKGILVSGRVLTQEGGRPVPDATLEIQGKPNLHLEKKTDADGRFSVRFGPEGGSVSVRKVGARSLVFPYSDGGSSTTKYVGYYPNAQFSLPLELRVPEAMLLPTIPHLVGKVVDLGGKPVAGATVRNLQGGEAVTDATGRFRFQTPTEPGSSVFASTAEATSVRPVEVKAGPEIALTLDAPTATITGTVAGEDGRPMAGIDVCLVAHRLGDWYETHASTDASGTYRFAGLYVGPTPFRVWARKKGFAMALIPEIAPTVGERVKLETMRLIPADGVIEGRVLEHDGRPAEGVNVLGQMVDAEPVVTDAQGRFRITGALRGRQKLLAGRGSANNADADVLSGQRDAVIKLHQLLPPGHTLPPEGLTRQEAPPIHADGWTNGPPPDTKGKIVVIDLWAVWSGASLVPLPYLEALHRRYPKDVVVVGLHASGTEKKTIAAFAKSKGLTYPIGLRPSNDPDLGPLGIPRLIVIGRDGRVVIDTHEAQKAERAVRRLLEPKLNPGAAP